VARDLDHDDYGDHDGDGGGSDDDGFWSGRLVDRHVEGAGRRRTDLDECQYRDPTIKTFAWWQAAMVRDERNCATLQPGLVLEEEVSESEDSMKTEDSWQRRKHDLSRQEEKEHSEGLDGLVKKHNMTQSESVLDDTDADAFFGQWLTSVGKH